MLSAIVVVLVFVCNQVSSEEYVYVKQTLPVVACIENPVKDICPVGYKIPDRHNVKSLKSQLENLMRLRSNVSQSCKAAEKNYFCRLFLPVCDDREDYIEVRGQKVVEACNQTLQVCPSSGVMFGSLFNCSLKEQRVKRRMICKDFPDVKNDPYPCSKRDYQVHKLTTSERYVAGLVEVHQWLKNTESKLNKECRDKVADAMCKIVFPACTKDRKHLVSFMTKEQCDKIFQCLNVPGIDPKLIENTGKGCSLLPGESAIKLTKAVVANAREPPTSSTPTSSTPTSSTPNNKATSQDGASKIFLFSFLSFLGLLF